jgi:hypothetical protein
MQRKTTVRNEARQYRKRKIWFWSVFIVLLLGASGLLYYCTTPETDNSKRLISVGICGEVRHDAVYHILEGSDLGQLIRFADGLTYNADIRKLDLNQIVLNDTIYHIPGRGYKSLAENTMLTELEKAISVQARNTALPSLYPDKDFRYVSILYVGFPAVYMLINYYPEQHRVSIVHIPHSTSFFNNDYRLIDVFFTLGIKPTVRMLENRLQQRIQYYVIQDRTSFIEMVNLLNGIDLDIDKPFADAYDLKSGIYHADGFYTWEYIRFLDIKRMHRVETDGNGKASSYGKDLVREDNFSIPTSTRMHEYEIRQYRQRIVMNGLRTAYAKTNPADQMGVITRIIKTFETDITGDEAIAFYKDLLSSPKFSYGTLPGYYSNAETKLYYYPDIPGFKLLLNKDLKRDFDENTGLKHTTY